MGRPVTKKKGRPVTEIKCLPVTKTNGRPGENQRSTLTKCLPFAGFPQFYPHEWLGQFQNSCNVLSVCLNWVWLQQQKDDIPLGLLLHFPAFLHWSPLWRIAKVGLFLLTQQLKVTLCAWTDSTVYFFNKVGWINLGLGKRYKSGKLARIGVSSTICVDSKLGMFSFEEEENIPYIQFGQVLVQNQIETEIVYLLCLSFLVLLDTLR